MSILVRGTLPLLFNLHINTAAAGYLSIRIVVNAIDLAKIPVASGSFKITLEVLELVVGHYHREAFRKSVAVLLTVCPLTKPALQGY